MPIGAQKNRLYGAALAVMGRRCPFGEVSCSQNGLPEAPALLRIFQRRHVVGASVQVFRQGKLAEGYVAGQARLRPSPVPVGPGTLFRTASVAKLAAATLVFRLQTLGMLDVNTDISDFLGYAVRNPRHAGSPITLAMLLSHTSSILDSPAYFAALQSGAPLRQLLADPAAFSGDAPGERFRYSNLAAGAIGCLLEGRFGRSLELLAQEYLFAPLGIVATFDLTALDVAQVAESYRVFPPNKAPSFDPLLRLQTAAPLTQPDPERRYLLASGNLYITAEGMARLALPLSSPDAGTEPAGFLDARSLHQMKTPLGQWPEEAVPMRHGMGLLTLDDRQVSSRALYGHQGFAYGAVNGVFFDEKGNGFVSLNSGASEQRLGHISSLNLDLIQLFLP